MQSIAVDANLQHSHREGMSTFESFELGPGETPTGVLSVALFANVRNASELLAEAKRGELDAALVSATRVAGAFAVLCAAARVVQNVAGDTMKTKAWTSELLYLLCCSNNVSTAFSEFGIKAGAARPVLVAFLHADAARIAAVLQRVQGDAVPLAQLATLRDAAAIQAHYGIADTELAVSDLEGAVCNRIALFGMKQAKDD